MDGVCAVCSVVWSGKVGAYLVEQQWEYLILKQNIFSFCSLCIIFLIDDDVRNLMMMMCSF